MTLAIEKAVAVGSACVAVRNSHHFGAAGYYVQLALPHDMLGFAATNAGPAVVPTFGLQAQLGTESVGPGHPDGP